MGLLYCAKTNKCFRILLVLAFGMGTSVGARNLTYNLNTAAGLPSDHIYNAITDHLGYLWLATTNGVVRYNGYEARVFGSNEGIPKEDVWNLLEDLSGRMWLASLSDEIGYLKNGHYHTALRDSGRFIYPSNLLRCGDGVAIKLDPHDHQAYQWGYYIYNSKGARKIYTPGVYSLLNTDTPELVACDSKWMFYRARLTDKQVLLRPWQHISIPATPRFNFFYFRQHICYYFPGARYLDVSDQTGKISRLSPFPNDQETIVLAHAKDSLFYVQSQLAVYVYDQDFQLKESHSLATLSSQEKIHDSHPCLFRRQPLWGMTLCTTDKGVYITTADAGALALREDLALDGFRQAGAPGGPVSYWWHDKSKQLKALSDGKIIYSRTIPGTIPEYVGNDRKWDPLLAGMAPFRINREQAKLIVFPGPQQNSYLASTLRAAISINRDSFFMLDYYALSLYTAGKHTRLFPTYCSAMSYDKRRHGLWLYQDQQIVFYDIRSNTTRTLQPWMLRRIGLRKVSAIIADPEYGNVFIRDDDRLFLLHDNMNRISPVLTQYRYKEAQMALQGDTLIIAGRFGLLYARITGKGIIGEPVVHENTRDLFYSHINALELSGNRVLLQTDRGVYETLLTSKSASGKDRSRLILFTDDTTRRLLPGDTVQLPAGTTSIGLDLVNPDGRGKPVYEYCINGHNWYQLKGNELSLDKFKPGRFYTVSLRSSDAVWRSQNIAVFLLVRPYWWQTTFFSAAILLALLALCIGIALVTRKLALRKQLQQQLTLEMNLNAVHAQINPHFIFNSLTTTQYLIRSGRSAEASEHLGRFSRLLRSFLKASRNKYTSISEEIGHLENYIALERKRFQIPFDSSIMVAPGVDLFWQIPSLLLQPLVENAIRHGLLNKEQKGTLLISFEPAPQGLIIRIDDDGIGRSGATASQEESRESYGTDLIGRLVQLFNKYEQTKVNITYIDKKVPQTGTIAVIHIHYPFL